MPEPVAWTVTVGEDFKNCIEITHCKEDAEAQYEASIEGGFESIYMLRSLITADQAEAYAATKVREALEEAARRCVESPMMNTDVYCGGTARLCADRILALIPLHDNQPNKEQT